MNKPLKPERRWFTPENVARAIAPLKKLHQKIFGPEAALSSVPLSALRLFYGDDYTVSLRGKPFTINLHDTILSFEVLVYRRWQPLETDLYERLIRPADYVVDVGANIGFFSVLFAELAFNGHVLAIEPEPNNMRLLRKNVTDRGHSERVSLAESAVGSKAGQATLYTASSGNLGDNRLYFSPERHGLAASIDRKPVTVPIARIDDLVSSWPRVDFIKMDIQGFEAHALEGATATLEANPEMLLFTELFPFGMRAAGSDPLAFIDRLRNYGFELWEISTMGRPLNLVEFGEERDFVERVEPGRGESNLICARGKHSIDRVRQLAQP